MSRDEKIRPPVFFIAIPTVLFLTLVLLTQHFFPQLNCPIRETTGIDCPGCGGTSATQHILKGNLTSAINSNAIITTGIIGVLLFCFWSSISKLRTGQYTALPINLKTGCLAISVTIVFTVLRNL